MNDIYADLLKHLLRLARSEGGYAAARELSHGSEYIGQLREALTESVAFLKENPELPPSQKLLPTLVVDVAHCAGEVIRFLGADSPTEEDGTKALKALREAGKDDQAEEMETYLGIKAYALSRLK